MTGAPTLENTVSTRYLDVETPTPEAIAPFGQLVGADPSAPRPEGAFYQAVSTYRPDFVSEDGTELAVCTVQRRPMSVQWMERHFKHTQAFIPLGGKPFLAILAPPTEGELPDLDQARAFLFDGQAGLLMHVGTWHEFPFALVDNTQLVVVLRSETMESLREENVIDGEAFGPDLDKKDIVRRLGVRLAPKL